jgi:glycosyltransferase involved in cell wall biosynthesis
VRLQLSTPSVSVVIPLYNKERHIARAIQSVLSQNGSDFELLVVNDGSTDGSAEVLKSFTDPRIRLVHREHVNSGGGHAARNLGIAESRADLIAFLDADDEWMPEHLGTLERLAEEYPACGIYASAYVMLEPGGKLNAPVFVGIPAYPWEGVIPNYFRSAASYPVWTSAVAVPRRVLDSVGLFPVGVPRGGDVDMWSRIAIRYPICYSTRVGAVYHKEADNRVCVLNQVLKEHRFIRDIQDAVRTGVIPSEQRRDALEFVAYCQIGVADTNVMTGNPRYARLLLRSCRNSRKHAFAWWRLMLLAMLPPGWPARLQAVKRAVWNLAGHRT